MADDEHLDVASLLVDLSGRELPQNVAREIAEWSWHAEKFVLYEGFALLEGDEDLPLADPFTVERISPTLRVVRSPDALYARLEKAALMPMRVRHKGALQALPPGVRTVFAHETLAPEPAGSAAVEGPSPNS